MTQTPLPAQGPVDVNVSPLPCPFCGDTPWFEGSAADWHDDNRYVELSLVCCASMTQRIDWSRARDMTVEARTSELRYRLVDEWNKRANVRGWIATSDQLPPDKTPVLIVLRGRVRIGELRWERPTHEETFRAFQYWDDPEDDGQDWEWHDITHWMPIPTPP